PERIRDERMKQMNHLVKDNLLDYQKRQLNKIVQVVIEKKKKNHYSGKSENYLDIQINTDQLLEVKKNYPVKIIEVTDSEVIGKLV
ncbi:MAG: hypothetical protein MJB14_10965, partial [Spirochaetes bacterium]|nr:hypothetical protein [Spirochaetota bacterium]